MASVCVWGGGGGGGVSGRVCVYIHPSIHPSGSALASIDFYGIPKPKLWIFKNQAVEQISFNRIMGIQIIRIRLIDIETAVVSSAFEPPKFYCIPEA